jgi:thioredoxin reductase (NADPH)
MRKERRLTDDWDFDVAVVGGGAAGLTCASAMARQGRRVVLYEAVAPGGQLLNLAEIHLVAGQAMPLMGVDLATSLMDAAFESGVEIRFEAVAHTRFDDGGWTIASPSPCRVSALVIATGSRPTPLDIAESDRFVGAGISYCAVCDGPLFAGRPVAVVGASPYAALEAAHLADVASDVLMIAPTAPVGVDGLLSRPNIEVATDAIVTEVVGEQRVSALRYRMPDGVTREAEVGGVFVILGRTTNEIDIETAVSVLRPPLATDVTMAVPDVPRLFAIGEARRAFHPSAIAAMGDGLQASASIVAALCAIAEHRPSGVGR